MINTRLSFYLTGRQTGPDWLISENNSSNTLMWRTSHRQICTFAFIWCWVGSLAKLEEAIKRLIRLAFSVNWRASRRICICKASHEFFPNSFDNGTISSAPFILSAVNLAFRLYTELLISHFKVQLYTSVSFLYA